MLAFYWLLPALYILSFADRYESFPLGIKHSSSITLIPRGNNQLPLRYHDTLIEANQLQRRSSIHGSCHVLRASDDGGQDDVSDDRDATLELILKAAAIGVVTGAVVVGFKSIILEVQVLLYEDLADLLPKPAFYWPIVLYPVIGASIVSIIRLCRNNLDQNNVRNIGSSIARGTDTADNRPRFDVAATTDLLLRLVGAATTLGSGCSLGPEGPAVEVGASVSRLVSRLFRASTSPGLRDQEARDLFLAGTAAGVGAGFNAPIAGIFFAIEGGSNYLVPIQSSGTDSSSSMNANLQQSRRGVDVAAMVIAATVADVVVGLGLHEKAALSVQGNLFAMRSPFIELPLYIGLGLLAGVVAFCFNLMRLTARGLFESVEPITEVISDSKLSHPATVSLAKAPLSSVPVALRPLLGGLLCGVVALWFPQTLFVGYATLDDLIAGKIQLSMLLASQLLLLKMVLSSFALESGLLGGVFAPSLFFGADAGTLYHDVMSQVLVTASTVVNSAAMQLPGTDVASTVQKVIQELTLASAPAYATVGAASVLAAIFRAPLTSSILMLELTENHEIVVPMLVSAATSSQACLMIQRVFEHK